ncbi:MAG: DUF2029 domain-containing protein [Hyphomonadaceae bacterium]|nr:DUF2029 domain-containing protein [Hyphomonadaceae bacterium]
MPLTVRPWMRLLFEVGAVLVALGLLGVFIWVLQGAHDWALASGQPVFGDYIAFWSAGRATLEGHVAEVHDRATTWIYHQQAITPIRFHAPWNSPPTFLLVVTPLALLPFPVSAVVFLTVTGAFYFVVARKLLPDARALLFAATMPAAFYHLATAQVGLLIAAITGLALHWLDKRPRAAGALVGLLAIKPHLAVLWPFLLAITGRWRAFFAAAVSTLSFILLAGLVFGFETYLRFFESLERSAALISEQRITTPAYASLFANLLQWHVDRDAATIAHAVSAALGAGLSGWIFLRTQRTQQFGAQAAALCAGTLLISPYLFFYDGILLGVGAALLGVPRTRFELLAAVLAWSAGLTLTIGYFLEPFPLCPLAAWVLLIAAFARSGNAAARPGQAQPT